MGGYGFCRIAWIAAGSLVLILGIGFSSSSRWSEQGYVLEGRRSEGNSGVKDGGDVHRLGSIQDELHRLDARMDGLSSRFGKISNRERDLSQDQHDLRNEEDEVRSAMHQTRREISRIRDKIDNIQSKRLESSLFPQKMHTVSVGKPAALGGAKAVSVVRRDLVRRARPSILNEMPRVSEVNGSRNLSIKVGKVSPDISRYARDYDAAERKQMQKYRSNKRLWVIQQQAYLQAQERYRSTIAQAMASETKAFQAPVQTK